MYLLGTTGENLRFDRCVLDWTGWTTSKELAENCRPNLRFSPVYCSLFTAPGHSFLILILPGSISQIVDHSTAVGVNPRVDDSSDQDQVCRNEGDQRKNKVISGVVAAASSVTSIQVANLLRLFKIPQVRPKGVKWNLLSRYQKIQYYS